MASMVTFPATDGWLIVTTGLLSGGHCIGMCGGFVAAYSLEIPTRTTHTFHWQRWMPHLSYHAGRIGLYILLGALFGILGGLPFWNETRHGVGGSIQLIFGIILVVYGLAALGVPGLEKWAAQGPSMAFVLRFAGPLLERAGRLRPLVFGLMTGLLPCNLHYAMQIKAASTGSALSGMTVLLFFGLGSALPLLILGLVTGRLSIQTKQWMFRGAGGLILLLGLRELFKGVQQLGL